MKCEDTLTREASGRSVTGEGVLLLTAGWAATRSRPHGNSHYPPEGMGDATKATSAPLFGALLGLKAVVVIADVEGSHRHEARLLEERGQFGR